MWVYCFTSAITLVLLLPLRFLALVRSHYVQYVDLAKGRVIRPSLNGPESFDTDLQNPDVDAWIKAKAVEI